MVQMLATLISTYLPANEKEEGQGLVEYALIIALIAVVVALVLPGLATAISGTFTDIAGSL